MRVCVCVCVPHGAYLSGGHVAVLGRHDDVHQHRIVRVRRARRRRGHTLPNLHHHTHKRTSRLSPVSAKECLACSMETHLVHGGLAVIRLVARVPRQLHKGRTKGNKRQVEPKQDDITYLQCAHEHR